MKATGWQNSGGTYGVRVGAANASEYFDKSWTAIEVEIDGQFHSLAHLIDELALARAYYRQRADAAVGVDGVTKEQYGQDLAKNIKDLDVVVDTGDSTHLVMVGPNFLNKYFPDAVYTVGPDGGLKLYGRVCSSL